MSTPIHVVHIINNLRMGGAEKLMSTLLPRMASEGIRCTLVCLEQGCEEPYRRALTEAGIQMHNLSEKGLYHPSLLFALGRILKKLNPDLIHAHLFPTMYWTALATMVYRIRVPLLLTEHTTSNRRMRLPWLNPLQQVVYRRYSCVVCISDGVQNALNEQIPHLPLKTIYNGIPLEIYAQKVTQCADEDLMRRVRLLKQHPDNKLVVSVGRLVDKKNQECMIRAMAHLPENVHLMIAGEGERRTVLTQLIAELHLEARVTLLGNRNDIAWLVQHADAGILTSVVEGFGLAAVEMMAAGLPVACSRVPGLGEVAADPSLLAEPEDDAGFADIISKLLGDASYRNHMVELGRKKASLFAIEHMAGAYATLYRKIMEDKATNHKSKEVGVRLIRSFIP